MQRRAVLVVGLLAVTACSPGATKPTDVGVPSPQAVSLDDFPDPELSAPEIPDTPPRGAERQRCGDLPYPGMGAMQAHDCWIVTMRSGNSIDALFAGGVDRKDPTVGLLAVARTDDVANRGDVLRVPGRHGDVTLIGVSLDVACFVNADDTRGAFSTLTWQFVASDQVDEMCRFAST